MSLSIEQIRCWCIDYALRMERYSKPTAMQVVTDATMFECFIMRQPAATVLELVQKDVNEA
jgi:hypothetical protein